jgi:Tol biopolymer transport system component
VVTLRNRSVFSVILGMLMAATPLAVVEPAHAAFPGENGRIAFSSIRSGNYEIYTMRANGTNVKLVPGASHPAWDQEPAYSPDGKKIAFRSNRSINGNWDIWVVNVSGTPKLTQITNNLADDQDPNWSPDGKRISFSSSRSGNWDIWSVSSTGTEMNPVNHTNRPANDRRPAYSPDGARIVFQSDFWVDWDIWTVNSANPLDLALITTLAADDEEPAYSPDGSRIAFARERSDSDSLQPRYDIWTTNSTGFEVGLVRITDVPADNEKPAYSPDGSRIVFDSDRSDVINDNYEIYTVSPSGTEVNLKKVTNHQAIDYAADWQAEDD